jgi:hypothetical protein
VKLLVELNLNESQVRSVLPARGGRLFDEL